MITAENRISKVYEKQEGVPAFHCTEFQPKGKAYAVLIPIINEGSRSRPGPGPDLSRRRYPGPLPENACQLHRCHRPGDRRDCSSLFCHRKPRVGIPGRAGAEAGVKI